MTELYNDLVSQRTIFWLDKLEKQISSLLEGISDRELSPKERLTIAGHYLSLMQRFLLVAQKQQAVEPSNDAQQALDSIRALMRSNLKSETEITDLKGFYHADRDSGF